MVSIDSGSVQIGPGTRLGLHDMRGSHQCIWRRRVELGSQGIRERKRGGRDREQRCEPNTLWKSKNDFSRVVQAVDMPSKKRQCPHADFREAEFCSKRD